MKAIASLWLLVLVAFSAYVLLDLIGFVDSMGLSVGIPEKVAESQILVDGLYTVFAALLFWAMFNIYLVSQMDGGNLNWTELITDYVTYIAVPLGLGVIAYILARVGVAFGSGDINSLVEPFSEYSSTIGSLEEDDPMASFVAKATYFALGARTGIRPIDTFSKLVGATLDPRK